MPVEGLALWTRSGEGLTVDAAGRVSRWADQSGQGNHLRQPAFAERPDARPRPRERPGRAALRRVERLDDVHDPTGRDDPRRLRGPEADGGERHMEGVPRRHDEGRLLPGLDALWGFASPLVLNGQTWLNGVAVDGTTTTRPETLSVLSVLPTGGVSADRLFAGKTNLPWIGDIAELVVYTEPLTGVQRKLVEDYLARRYALYVPTVIEPLVSPDGGTFEGSIDVTLTAPTPGSVVRYTLDGSDPTEASPLYDGPLSLTRSATLKARAFRPGHIASPVSTAGFVSASDFSPASIGGLGCG